MRSEGRSLQSSGRKWCDDRPEKSTVWTLLPLTGEARILPTSLHARRLRGCSLRGRMGVAGAGRHPGGLGGLLRHELLLAAGAAPVEPEGRQHPHPGSPLEATKAGQAAGTSEKQIQQHHRRVQTGKVSTLFPRRCFAVYATVKHPCSILWVRRACSERAARATDC